METHPPWTDLPPPLLDQILDRLPLPDYIRFSSVCPKWRSVKIDHRLRHSPNHLLSYLKQNDEHNNENKDDGGEEETIIIPCYSPFEQRFYHLNLPISSPSHFCCASSSSHGWILLQQRNYDKNVDPSDIEIVGRSRNSRRSMRKQMLRNWPPPLPNNVLSFYFLNPISKLRISLPLIPLRLPSGYYSAVSNSHRCIALVVTGSRELFLFRDGDTDWILLPVPEGASIIEAIYCGEKFYCNCSNSSIVMIDPSRPTPSVEHFEMETSQMPIGPSLVIALESDGELFLVNAFFNFEEEFEITGFQVFKADFCNKMWVRIECLGDRMLLLGRYSSVSLVADRVGGRRNCIYFSEGSIGNPFSSREAE